MPVKRKNRELKIIFAVILLLFGAFLALPVLRLLIKSFWNGSGVTLEYYRSVFSGRGFAAALKNSFAVSAASAGLSVLAAFVMAYAVHYTNLPGWFKRAIGAAAVLPMFLPTITYGFAIIYSFGRQGLIPACWAGSCSISTASGAF